MRFSSALARVPLLLVVLCPVTLSAQFLEPTKEELQMTADAKAPGAPYVFLYREDVTDQTTNTRTFYERIKILTEKGKETATVEIPYVLKAEKVPEVQGRTIHADGTIIPLTAQPADLVDVKTREYQVDKVVFTLPSAEVGSIVEYRVVEKLPGGVDDPTWMIQPAQFVHKAHYVFKTYGRPDLSYVSRIGPGMSVQHKGNEYWLDATDVPPLPDDDYMPPINTLKWRVSFFQTFFSSSDAYWLAANKSWAEMMQQVLDPTGGLKKAVATIVEPGDGETVRARKIYAAVMKLENTDYVREKSKEERKKEKIKDINTVEDVWKQQRGSSDDIALLYIAMSRAAGLNASPMKVVDRKLALFDEGFLTSGQLDDYIVVAMLDGKQVYLDPGEKMCPFGTLSWRHMLAQGFLLNGKTSSIAHTPAESYKASSEGRVAELTIDESGNVEGTIRFVLTGQDALYWRQLTLQNDESEVKKQFNEEVKAYLPVGVQADFDHFLGLDDYESNLMGIVKVTGTLGTATGKRMFLPGLLFQANAKHPFVAQENRSIPVDVHYAKLETDDVTYHLPAGYTVESAPQPGKIGWSNYAAFSIASKSEVGSITVMRMLAYGFVVLDPKQYGELRGFYQKVAAADQQPIVLIRSAAAKGN